MLNLYKAYADLLTKDNLDCIHRQLWTDLTDCMKLNNVMVIVVFFVNDVTVFVIVVLFYSTLCNHTLFFICCYESVRMDVVRLESIALVICTQDFTETSQSIKYLLNRAGNDYNFFNS